MLQKENPKKEKSEGRSSVSLVYTTLHFNHCAVINVKGPKFKKCLHILSIFMFCQVLNFNEYPSK